MQHVVRHRPGESDLTVRLTLHQDKALRFATKESALLVADVIHMFAVLQGLPTPKPVKDHWILEYRLGPEEDDLLYVNDPRI
jgi:hypothetical protein